MVAQVSAQGPELSIGDVETAPGTEVTVDLVANVPDGLGAWTIDVDYDTSVLEVDATDCDGGDANSVCNPAYADGVVRVTGASASGIDEETILSTLSFTCLDDEAESPLGLTISVFADATIGDPQDISGDTTVSDGSVTCAVPEPTVEPAAATATTGLPVVGSPPSSDGDSFGWVIAALAGAGVAALAGFGALRMRTRSS
jgi:hypothetical protein